MEEKGLVWGISELKGLGDFGGFIPNKGLVGGVPEMGFLSPNHRGEGIALGLPELGFCPQNRGDMLGKGLD